MRKILFLIFLLSILSASTIRIIWALEKKKTVPKEEKREVETAVIQPEVSGQEKKKEVLLKKAKAILASQDWVIFIRALDDKEAAFEQDTLVFLEGKLSTANSQGKGYQPAKYSLVAQDDESVVWEALLENQQGELLSFRGELKGEILRGVLSKQNLKGTVKDYYFDTFAPAVPVMQLPVIKEDTTQVKRRRRK